MTVRDDLHSLHCSDIDINKELSEFEQDHPRVCMTKVQIRETTKREKTGHERLLLALSSQIDKLVDAVPLLGDGAVIWLW